VKNNLSQKILHYLLLIFSIGLFLLSSCTERGYDNPFDPRGTSDPPLSLSVNSDDNNTIELSWHWQSIPVTDYSGFRIYRSIDNVNFSQISEVPKGQFSYTDTSVQQYSWFYYKISVYGPLVESELSQSQKIYLGQGFYWILSSYGFWVRKVSYDLQRSMRNYYTTYPCEEWAVSFEDSLINLAYIRFSNGVSQLNLQKGIEDFYFSEDLNSPIDVEYDEALDRMYVLDVNGENQDDQIFVIKNKILERKIILPIENYLKLYLSNQKNSLVILGETKYYELSTTSSAIIDSVLFSPGFLGQDMDVSDDSIYVLTFSKQTSMSKIYKTDFQDNVTDSLLVPGHFYRITKNRNSPQYLLAEELDLAPDKLVKLSSHGARQFELSGFEYIEQIGLNPYDNTIVVVDRFRDQLVLLDNNGNEISRSKTNSFYDPIRIFFE
jgi:hypothetical protein